MTTTDTGQGIEIVYQVGLRRIASRRFCVAVFNQLSTHLFTRQEIRDGVCDRSTAAVITFLSELLTKTPSIDVVRDESTLVYLISTITPTIRGKRLAQVDAIASLLQSAIKMHFPGALHDNTPRTGGTRKTWWNAPHIGPYQKNEPHYGALQTTRGRARAEGTAGEGVIHSARAHDVRAGSLFRKVRFVVIGNTGNYLPSQREATAF